MVCYFAKYLTIYINKNKDLSIFRKEIIKNIVSGYLADMKKYVIDATEAIRIQQIYYSIPNQIGNKSNKFQYSLVHDGARSKNYETAMQWLISSELICKVNLLNKPIIPPNAYIDDNYFKLYLSDVGILNSVLNIKFDDIILNKIFLYRGELTENYVCEQLRANFDDLYYWKSNNTAELDFVIYNDDGIIPIEVKANDNVQSKSLLTYMKSFKPNYGIRLSTKNFGFENNIKSVPLYATFCIK